MLSSGRASATKIGVNLHWSTKSGLWSGRWTGLTVWRAAQPRSPPARRRQVVARGGQSCAQHDLEARLGRDKKLEMKYLQHSKFYGYGRQASQEKSTNLGRLFVTANLLANLLAWQKREAKPLRRPLVRRCHNWFTIGLNYFTLNVA